MLMRTLSIGAVAISLAASAAMAAGFAERLQAERMTVLQVDQESGKFLCVEHGRWTAVARDNLAGVHQGDIVKVERSQGEPARLVVLRTAAEELTSPEL
jgi:hypothetical protein